ncbi:sensor histidine kinase [Pedobacter sp. WC2501]|uniref:sensor histidine kinase n=1 Tax=Pedobacter sp. WC2501 TaxID=3461400 RepID=UPI004046298B
MQKHSYKLFRLYGYPGFGVLLYLIMVLINPLERTMASWKHYSVLDFILEFTFSIFYATVLFETGIQITTALNKWYNWEGRIKSRFAIQVMTQILTIYILITLFFQFRFPARFGYDELMSRQILIIGVIFSLLITAVFAAEHFFYKWRDASSRSLELEQHTTQAQLEALKLQLDPHFMFNNLSIVTALIEDQPKTAISYISKLSSIYRYMLANRMRNVIAVAEELEFIKAYLYLYEIRYGDGIQISVEESKAAASQGLPPLTLQLLIENAIKHSVFSLDYPLRINIRFPNNDTIIVENNKTVKVSNDYSSKLGLQNINERYRLMNQPLPVVTETNSCFMVEVAMFTLN